MKQNYVIALASLLLALPLFSAAPMEERNVTTEITKVAAQNDATKPKLVKKISNLESAKNWIQQKANCLLLDSEKCNKTDLLVTNYALGFAMGASFPIHLVAGALYQSGKTESLLLISLAQGLAELTLGALGLKGAVMQPYINGLVNKFTTFAFVIADVATLSHYASQAPSRTAFLKLLGRYLASNTKCIWSEKHCLPSLNKEITQEGIVLSPFTRRAILYFWMGYISGLAARHIPFGKIVRSITPTIVPVPENF